MLLLKFAGLEYSENRGGYGNAPKGKLPYINDRGLIVAHSTFVRFHLEKKYGFDFDAGLTPEQRAAAWAVEKMCEEHLYFALVATRWLDDANFAKGPAQFFKTVPIPPADRAKPSCSQSVETTRFFVPYASRAGRPRDCRHQCTRFAFEGQGFFDGRKALRGGCDGLRLRRELSHAVFDTQIRTAA